ncbi:Septal ring factor EnvC, activator of murein hydrolases AmiA and AmiB [Sphingomonas palmae]|uniref:Septal ring factor EnvC, activator of murein hydrolases AmiA and AmiB n=1 Tax=Sphingomonas palmae TaxID=1855283 RepID=A0A1H7TBR9_9SPHN|nr:peptidoglycan DD-metalloendopeptidase family protein [Sphingomonas palmae]SEL82312.1 Septal ring factor EnvC, activator of murein hydrolases AmiA and AmiB [Sphingomonas palmae]
MRRLLSAVAALLLSGSLLGIVAQATAAPELTTSAALRTARAHRAAAQARAAQADRAAAATGNPTRRARFSEAALEARVEIAEAEIAIADLRAAATDKALAEQREQLAAQQEPIARLLSGLTALARRPAAIAIVQPGSLDDLVHVRAVLDAALPVVRARTAAIRGELAQTRALHASAAALQAELGAGRAQLLGARRALAALRDEPLDAGTASDRALALGERARDAVDRLRGAGDAQATLASLVSLPGPPIPAVAAEMAAPYRLPVKGRLVTGFGELSDNGVRARGLTFAVAPAARVVAPAAGRIVFARPFRGFGTIVIIDHGQGWVTLLTGLAELSVAREQQVAAGALIGTAASSKAGDEAPQVTVELRRRGRPVDLTLLI